MFRKIEVLIIFFCFALFGTANSEQNNPCEIGVIHVQKGVWINRDTILSNCEKCYQNDKVEMQKCKDIYLQHGHQNAEDYQKLLAKERDEIPKLIEAIKKEKAPLQVTRYFPEVSSLSSIPPESLKVLLSLSKKDLDAMEGIHLEEMSTLLREVQKKIKLYAMFQVLLQSETPRLSLKDLTMDNETFQSITYYYEFKRKSKAELFLAYFNFFRIMKGSMDYDRFMRKTQENPVLSLAFSIQENIGYSASLKQPAINPGLVTAYLDTLAKFSKEDLDLIFYSNYFHNAIVAPIDKQICDGYQENLKKCGSAADSARGILEFKKSFPYESMQRYMTLVELYGRDIPRMVTIGKFSVNMNSNRAYEILKKIYQ